MVMVSTSVVVTFTARVVFSLDFRQQAMETARPGATQLYPAVVYEASNLLWNGKLREVM